MQVAFGRLRRRIAPLRTGSPLRNTHISKVHLFVVMRFIASLRKSCLKKEITLSHDNEKNISSIIVVSVVLRVRCGHTCL